jgi:hypothetical protein
MRRLGVTERCPRCGLLIGCVNLIDTNDCLIAVILRGPEVISHLFYFLM